MKSTPSQRAASRTASFYRHLAVRSAADQVDPHTATVTYKHTIKAVAASRICYAIMRRSGASLEALMYTDPVLHYIEALVYRGDLETENNQQQGRHPTDATWYQAIEQILHSADLADEAVLSELNELRDYFDRETHVMLRRAPVDDATIHDLCYRRSSHFRMLLRAWHRAIDRPCDEAFFRLARHVCARFEIAQDLHTYTDDVDDDAFNLLRLYVWSHGTQQARTCLDHLHQRIVADIHHELDRSPRRTLLAALPAFFLPGSTWFLPLLPACLLRRYAHRKLKKQARATESQAPQLRPEGPQRAAPEPSAVQN
ncbi:hypothetical protein [Streptomyces bluensis]|uniref:hypothetical protein n=1 Tax=Streptomyces bluensis TaxID=33897 RepID=UPI001062BD1D|nr:hypothetical protein [Streptomyces bluensis]GGZ77730.1 hypothetical protein GCM10010344_51050 [Streptomyces bluensis]